MCFSLQRVLARAENAHSMAPSGNLFFGRRRRASNDRQSVPRQTDDVQRRPQRRHPPSKSAHSIDASAATAAIAAASSSATATATEFSRGETRVPLHRAVLLLSGDFEPRPEDAHDHESPGSRSRRVRCENTSVSDRRVREERHEHARAQVTLHQGV